jgi:hypothetical protein
MKLTLEIPPLLIKKFSVLSQLLPDPNIDIDEFFVAQIDRIVSAEILSHLGMAEKVPVLSAGASKKPLSVTIPETESQHFEGLGEEEVDIEEDDDEDFPAELRLDREEMEEPVRQAPPKNMAKNLITESKPTAKTSAGKKLSKTARAKALAAMEQEIEEAAEEDTRRPQPIVRDGTSPEDAFAIQLSGDPKARAPRVVEEEPEDLTPAFTNRRSPRKLPSSVTISEYTGK